MPLPKRMSNSASLYGAAHLFFTICRRAQARKMVVGHEGLEKTE